MPLDPKVTEKILDADIANILKKVKAGKPLSAAERERIAQAGEGERPQIVDTMAQAVSITGLPLSLLKLYKRRKDCTAFLKGSRVNIDALKAFHAEHADEVKAMPVITKEEADIKLKLLKYDREMFAFERDKGMHIEKAKLGAEIKQIATHQRLVLQRKLETELPPKLLGKSVIEIAQAMREAVDEICRIFHDRTTPWQTTQ